MRKTIHLLALQLIILLNAGCSGKERQIESLIKTELISENVLFVRMGYDAVTAIKSQKGIVVIDAGISNSLTEKYRKIIKDKFKGVGFSYVINTHGHNDHTAGNQVFSDAIIIGHQNTPAEMTEKWKVVENSRPRLLKLIEDYQNELDTLVPGSKEWSTAFCQIIRYQSTYNDIIKGHVIAIPSSTFSDSLSVDLGDITINTIYFGKAHSESDILIHSPELRLLMTGDLFFKGGKPSFRGTAGKDTLQWRKALKWLTLRLDQTDMVIEGHGDILGREDLRAFIGNTEKMLNTVN